MAILGFHVVDRYHLPDGKIGMFVRSALWRRDPKGVFWARSHYGIAEILPRLRRFAR